MRKIAATINEYLNKRANQDRQYRAYVEKSIKEAEEDIRLGRVEPLEKVLLEIEEEFGLEHYE